MMPSDAGESFAWHVSRQPGTIDVSFFISHVREDLSEVIRLKKRLERRRAKSKPRVSCFLDEEDWPHGNAASVVIKSHLRRARHLIGWVTPAYLENSRGWIWMELAYAELIELGDNARYGEMRFPFIVPIFRGVTLDDIARTPWLPYWQRQLHAGANELSIEKIAERLVSFFDQEAAKHNKADAAS